MEKSLLEVAKEYLNEQAGAVHIDDVLKNVEKNSGYTKAEFKEAKAKFYTDFTLSSDFVYCGADTFDLKNREKEDLYDCDSSFFIDPKERRKKIAARKKAKEDAEAKLKKEKDVISGYDGEDDVIAEEETILEDELDIDDLEDDDIQALDIDDLDLDLEDDDDDDEEAIDSTDFSDYDDDDDDTKHYKK